MTEVEKIVERLKSGTERANEAGKRGKFLCEDINHMNIATPGSGCGELDHIEFEGTAISELLEDVVFEVRINNGQFDVIFQSSTVDEEYLKGLNEDYWIAKVKEYLNDGNVVEFCPKCGNDLEVPDLKA